MTEKELETKPSEESAQKSGRRAPLPGLAALALGLLSPEGILMGIAAIFVFPVMGGAGAAFQILGASQGDYRQVWWIAVAFFVIEVLRELRRSVRAAALPVGTGLIGLAVGFVVAHQSGLTTGVLPIVMAVLASAFGIASLVWGRGAWRQGEADGTNLA